MGLDGVRAMIFGHSHEPICAESPEILYYNPGYAGPDLTEPVRTAGVLYIEGANITARTYFLSPPPREEYFSKAQIFSDALEK
jgi:predicted phosphodiesterase